MADAFSMRFDASDLLDALDGITEAAEEHVRPAAQAGIQVLYDEVLLRVPVSTKVRKLKSGRVVAPGALRASIYRWIYHEGVRSYFASFSISSSEMSKLAWTLCTSS